MTRGIDNVGWAGGDIKYSPDNNYRNAREIRHMSRTELEAAIAQMTALELRVPDARWCYLRVAGMRVYLVGVYNIKFGRDAG